MRRDLQARGLIDEAHRLTPAGNAYCDALLVDLVKREAAPVAKRPVRWTRRRRGRYS